MLFIALARLGGLKPTTFIMSWAPTALFSSFDDSKSAGDN